MNWRTHITVDPEVAHGQACFKGTRVLISVILDNLAADVPAAEILRSYPSLTPDAIRASIAYAAELARDQMILMPA